MSLSHSPLSHSHCLYLPVSLPACLSVRPSVRLSFCLSIYVCLSLSHYQFSLCSPVNGYQSLFAIFDINRLCFENLNCIVLAYLGFILT